MYRAQMSCYHSIMNGNNDMIIRETINQIYEKKPFSPWLPIFVGIGTAVGAGPDVSMAIGVGASFVFGVVFSLWRMRAA